MNNGFLSLMIGAFIGNSEYKMNAKIQGVMAEVNLLKNENQKLKNQVNTLKQQLETKEPDFIAYPETGGESDLDCFIRKHHC